MGWESFYENAHMWFFCRCLETLKRLDFFRYDRSGVDNISNCDMLGILTGYCKNMKTLYLRGIALGVSNKILGFF